MYANSGYLNNSRMPFKDKSRPLIVGSCGTYRLKNKFKLPTWNPRGRVDYQILYVASGRTHFFFNGEEKIVTAGHMVLYQPKEEQKYDYYGEDKPEVYWVHFTGSDVKNILHHYNIPLSGHVFYCGTSPIYVMLFKQIILEFQNCSVGYQEMLEMCLRQLLLAVQRARLEKPSVVDSHVHDEMEAARQYFNEHYNEPIVIEEFAQSRHISVSLFMRNFKRVFNVSPKQYIQDVRMNNAQSLLATTDYSVAEIAAIVGFDNPLYFSRQYRKEKGMSPTHYRKLLKEET